MLKYYISWILFSIIIAHSSSKSIVSKIIGETENNILGGITGLFYPEGGLLSYLPAVNETTENWITREFKFLNNSILPCKCKTVQCNCCFNLDLSLLNIQHSGCLKLSYDKYTKMSHIEGVYDQNDLFSITIPLRNPSPECINIGNIPGLSMCLSFYNISINQERALACLDLQPFIYQNQLLTSDFNVRFSCLEFNWEEGIELNSLNGERLNLFAFNSNKNRN